MRNFVVCAGLVMALATPVSAAWHVEDVDGHLLIIGAGEAKSGGSGFLTIRCEGKTLSITGTTPYSIAWPDEIDGYRGARVTLRFGGIGERQDLELEATASESVGRAVLATIHLDEQQSATVMKSIRSGNRLEFAVKHPDMDAESTDIRVYNGGFTTVTFAVDKRCPGFAS